MSGDRFLSSNDDSWERALDIVRETVQVPFTLPQLMRGCWSSLIDPLKFISLVGEQGYSPGAILRAAQVHQAGDKPTSSELRAALDILGLKAASIIVAVNCLCERTLNSGPPNRVWTTLFKEMMSDIEIGYHFGSNVARVGHEYGMLVGFSRLSGLLPLLAHSSNTFERWYLDTKNKTDAVSARELFGCEPYQVSSVLLQHLGLGIEVSTIVAGVLKDGDADVISNNPSLQRWRATHKWLAALREGKDCPEDMSAQQAFPELAAKPGETMPASHLVILRDQLALIRRDHSRWTWHLPLLSYEETSRAMVYRVSSDSRGTTWSKSLTIGDSRSR